MYNTDLTLLSLSPTLHVGQFHLPISCLREPIASRLVRPVDKLFVDSLKKEMLLNPTMDVAPMIGLVCLRTGEEFDRLHPEAYTYETLGGNNSRTALSELLQENPELTADPRYTKHMVSVYCNLSDEEAQLLGVKHNRQQSFVHQTTTQDKVSVIRNHYQSSISTVLSYMQCRFICAG